MISFDLPLFLYQLGIFIVFAVSVTVIFNRLLLPIMRERRERIQGDMDRAAAALTDAEVLKGKYDEKMAAVGQEAAAIIKRVNDEAAKHREELMAQTRRQTDNLMKQAEELIAIEEAQARARLRRDAADIAVSVAGRVLDETRTDDREYELARKFISELEQRGLSDHRLDG